MSKYIAIEVIICMIIKKVIFGDGEGRNGLQEKEKAPSPRIMMRVKKRKQNNQQLSLQKANENESNHFNDSHYFNTQYGLQLGDKIGKDSNEGCEHIHEIQMRRKTGSGFYPACNYSQQNHIKPSSLSKMKTSSIPSIYFTKQLNQYETIKAHTMTLKTTHQKSCESNNCKKKEYFHQRVTQSSSERRPKKINSSDYSIIKPNQIKAFPLSHRDEFKPVSKKKVDRRNFPQLVDALKRKEELKVQRDMIHQRHRIGSMRLDIRTSYIKRLNIGTIDEKNQLVPWQNEISSIDFI